MPRHLLTGNLRLIAHLAIISFMGLISAPDARCQTIGFLTGNKLPSLTYFRSDYVRHNTDGFHGRWFILKRGAAWCAPCVAERPAVNQFMVAYPEIPILMGVAPPPPDFSTEARVAQMSKDVEFNRTHGFDPHIVVVLEKTGLPTPPGFEQLPLTILVNSAGVIARSWRASDVLADLQNYSRLADRQLKWNELVEAALICGGSGVRKASEVAARLASDPGFCPR